MREGGREGGGREREGEGGREGAEIPREGRAHQRFDLVLEQEANAGLKYLSPVRPLGREKEE